MSYHAFVQRPANFPEEIRLLCQTQRILFLIERLQIAFMRKKTGPRLLLADLAEFLGHAVNAIEDQLARPGLDAWLDQQDLKRRPPARLSLLVHLLGSAARACTAAVDAHDQAAQDLEDKPACNCNLCFDLFFTRGLLRRARRLLTAGCRARKAVH